MSQSSLPPLGAGRIVAQSFGLLFARFSTIFPMAFVPAVMLSLLNRAAFPTAPVSEGAMTEGANVPATGAEEAMMPALPGFGQMMLGSLSMVLSYFVVGLLCLVALDAVIGKRHTVGQYARQAARQLLPIAVLGILISVLAGVGLALLIVPGIYVLARFLPWVEAVVFEDAGWRGLGRAQDLTEGYRWPLVGAVLLMGIVLVGLGMLAGAALYAVETNLALSLLVESIVSAVYHAIFAIFTALVYARLREVKEGMTVEQIAATIG